MSNPMWHVCSLVVQYKEDRAEEVKKAISQLPDTEIIASNEEEYKYVVLMESEDTDLLYKKMESLHYLDGVMAVSLVYHQQDEQTEDLT